MKKTNSQQIRALRAKAHALKPIVIIGQHGLTSPVQEEINQGLIAHELIKIRVNTQDRDVIKQIANEICAKQQATLVQIIGHIVVIYRHHEKN